MSIGTVKWFDYKKGYGFILSPRGEDVMAHFAAIEGAGFRRLYPREKVHYEAEMGSKGLKATRVRHIDPIGISPNSRVARQHRIANVASTRNSIAKQAFPELTAIVPSAGDLP